MFEVTAKFENEKAKNDFVEVVQGTDLSVFQSDNVLAPNHVQREGDTFFFTRQMDEVTPQQTAGAAAELESAVPDPSVKGEDFTVPESSSEASVTDEPATSQADGEGEVTIPSDGGDVNGAELAEPERIDPTGERTPLDELRHDIDREIDEFEAQTKGEGQ